MDDSGWPIEKLGSWHYMLATPIGFHYQLNVKCDSLKKGSAHVRESYCIMV